MSIVISKPNLTHEEATAILDEAQKWEEGGTYRVALHTATGLLTTGTIQGGLSAGTTAYTIPKIDEYLTEQGFNKETRDITLLTLSAGLGATIGDSTASTANNLGQTQGNYLSHDQFNNKILCIRGGLENCNLQYDKISKEQDLKLKQTCTASPNSYSCYQQMKSALEYIGTKRNHYAKSSDINDSTKNALNIANGFGYSAIKTLDDRANYYGAMYGYTGQPWFRVAEKHSRGQLKIADNTGFSGWISEAGDAIMKKGKPEFQYIYQNYQNETNSWSYKRLYNEQYDPALQTIHEKYYNSWLPVTQWYVDHQVGGEFLNPQHRFNTGCKDMPEVQECQK